MSGEPFEGSNHWNKLITIVPGCFLQRLFSTFPNSWPGFGLLLLRLGLSVPLIAFAIAAIAEKPSEPVNLTQNLIAALAGMFLIAGLWTPPAAGLLALDEIWIAWAFYSSQREIAWIHFFLAMLALGLAMLGPGAWSIDARLFGRQRFDIDGRGRKPPL